MKCFAPNYALQPGRNSSQQGIVTPEAKMSSNCTEVVFLPLDNAKIDSTVDVPVNVEASPPQKSSNGLKRNVKGSHEALNISFDL